jgi:hypothetical protein
LQFAPLRLGDRQPPDGIADRRGNRICGEPKLVQDYIRVPGMWSISEEVAAMAAREAAG